MLSLIEFDKMFLKKNLNFNKMNHCMKKELQNREFLKTKFYIFASRN